ncbi:hypothetical protein FB451DRAFT_1535430 [Mycena latifolia]|nr:hypothetical protein FB451DRAFT_1535430 [Mycena latifolia]
MSLQGYCTCQTILIYYSAKLIPHPKYLSINSLTIHGWARGCLVGRPNRVHGQLKGYTDALNINYVSVGYRLKSGLFNSSHLANEDQGTNHIVSFQTPSHNRLANVQVSNMVQINLKELTCMRLPLTQLCVGGGGGSGAGRVQGKKNCKMVLNMAEERDAEWCKGWQFEANFVYVPTFTAQLLESSSAPADTHRRHALLGGILGGLWLLGILGALLFMLRRRRLRRNQRDSKFLIDPEASPAPESRALLRPSSPSSPPSPISRDVDHAIAERRSSVAPTSRSRVRHIQEKMDEMQRMIIEPVREYALPAAHQIDLLRGRIRKLESQHELMWMEDAPPGYRQFNGTGCCSCRSTRPDLRYLGGVYTRRRWCRKTSMWCLIMTSIFRRRLPRLARSAFQ